MRQDAKAARQQQIEEAAYAVLEEKGFAGASMLAIARKARASNETLYNWYGDKTGLFKALVARNAAEVRGLLEARIAAGGDAVETLGAFGPPLLAMLTGDRAVALNRAAAADASGTLGQAIAEEGRERVAPLILQVLDQARAQGHIGFSDPAEALDLYLGLLIGDLQIRRVIGRLNTLTGPECQARSDRALQALRRVLNLG
ncbi:MAG: TetR/AcrR family transcriptional regulator [Pseudomonadota bacterium]